MDRVRAVFPMATSKIAAAMESMGDILESGVEESYVQRRGRYAQEANTGLQGDEFWRNLWVAHIVRRPLVHVECFLQHLFNGSEGDEKTQSSSWCVARSMGLLKNSMSCWNRSACGPH